MFKGKLAMVLTSLLPFAVNVYATEYTMDTTIRSVVSQGARPSSPNFQNKQFVGLPLTAAWTQHDGSGGTPCAQGVAVIPDDNPWMFSIALTAKNENKTIQITVDNTLPMTNGQYCQITSISIL